MNKEWIEPKMEEMSIDNGSKPNGQETFSGADSSLMLS